MRNPGGVGVNFHVICHYAGTVLVLCVSRRANMFFGTHNMCPMINRKEIASVKNRALFIDDSKCQKT